MFQTPYQTTPCSRYDLSRTSAAIKRMEIENQLVKANFTGVDIRLVPAGTEGFPPFLQPLTKLEYPTFDSQVVLDGRSLLRVDQTPVKLDDYQHAILTAGLTGMWMTQGPSMRRDLLNLGAFPAKVFINWVCGPIVTRLGLDMGQAIIIRALAAIYYVQCFDPYPANATKDDRDRLLVRCNRLLPAMDINTLEQLVGEIPQLNKLDDFIQWMIKSLDTPRLHQLNVDFIYTALGTNFGPRYREAVAVALEYPPVFLAMVYTACTQRSYQKSGLGRIIENLISRGDHKEYIKNLNHITGMKSL